MLEILRNKNNAENRELTLKIKV